MVPPSSEALFPTRVLRFRKAAANVAGNDSSLFAQFPERPFEIRDRESAILPICHGVLRTKTIEIDCDVNFATRDIRCECFKSVSPILAQDRPAALSIFHRTLVSPGMNFKPAFSFAAPIGKDILRPPAFEISAAPNGGVLNIHELERAIDPAATAPLWRTNGPVRMIIKCNEDDRSTQP